MAKNIFTKTNMVDYIHHNFLRKKKRIPKAELKRWDEEKLRDFVYKYGSEEKLEAWVNRPKPIKFFVDGIQNSEELSWDCEYISEEELRKAFEAENITIEKIVPAKGNHRCKYCNEIAFGTNKDELCEECKGFFGHIYYSEL